MTLNDLIRKANEANMEAMKFSPSDLELTILDGLCAATHGRKIKDIAIFPYAEQGEMKMGIMFEEDKP